MRGATLASQHSDTSGRQSGPDGASSRQKPLTEKKGCERENNHNRSSRAESRNGAGISYGRSADPEPGAHFLREKKKGWEPGKCSR